MQNTPPSNAMELRTLQLPTFEEMEAAYRGPDRHGRGNYPVRPPRPCENEQVQRIQNKALFNAIMADLGAPNLCNKSLCEGKPMSYPQEKVITVLRKHLGLPINH